MMFSRYGPVIASLSGTSSFRILIIFKRKKNTNFGTFFWGIVFELICYFLYIWKKRNKMIKSCNYMNFLLFLSHWNNLRWVNETWEVLRNNGDDLMFNWNKFTFAFALNRKVQNHRVFFHHENIFLISLS